MEFDSLKPIGGATVKNDFAPKKTYSNEPVNTEVVKETSAPLKGKVANVDNSSQDSSKYSEEDLYKGEHFQQKMDKAISEANKMLEPAHKSLSYSVHEETNEIMIKVTDIDTGEVIKEIPSEESLDMVAKMRELAGIVIDEKR